MRNLRITKDISKCRRLIPKNLSKPFQALRHTASVLNQVFVDVPEKCNKRRNEHATEK